MRIEAVELVTVAMRLREPFTTSFGRQHDREILLVRVVTAESEGWGEVTAPAAPVYSHEYTAGARAVLDTHLVPALLADPVLDPAGVPGRLAGFRGHPMAKAALEIAVVDAALRAAGESLATTVGAVRARVPAGVSVGVPDGGVGELADRVAAYVEQGYVRVKLKITPAFDVAPLRVVRDRFPDLELTADANAAYGPGDVERLTALDEFGLAMLEQPLPADHLLGHAALAKRLATPICLDESIGSPVAAAEALALGACEVVNVKVGRLGGLLAALATLEVCRAHGAGAWIGGMLETGVGRAVNVALAATPAVTAPGDTSASDRYWRRDLTAPFVLDGGHVAVPDGPGLGVTPDADRLREVEVDRRAVRPDATTGRDRRGEGGG